MNCIAVGTCYWVLHVVYTVVHEKRGLMHVKNIVSVCSHNTSAYFHRTTPLLISLLFSVSAFAGRSCS